MDVQTQSALETRKLGEKYTRKLKGGEILTLSGELGAGKTTFVQGLAKGLGIKEPVTSPSFTLIKEYSADKNLTLCHIDLYRIKTQKEAESLGMEEYLNRKDSICVIEWPKVIKSLLDRRKSLWLNFKYVDKDKRRITEIRRQ